MKKFCFKGEFREYQERVLDNALTHFKDNHIHIVAAPGSGKTILGLELICRLGKPTLVLSPTLSIRNQWKQRFAESFLESENVDDIVSTSLKDTKFITSITYQTLYSAFNKLKVAASAGAIEQEKFEDLEISEDTSDWDQIYEDEDYEDFDFLRVLKDSGIKTICLDEAHHLRSEWQRALETFLSKLDNDCKVIALTATPPYDSNKSEWDKYIKVCGEIDDEIFVPELVKAKNLCYHQDYIYFNYPSGYEFNVMKDFDTKIDNFVAELFQEGLLQRLSEENFIFKDPDTHLDECFDDEEDFIGFLNLLDYSKEYIPPDIRKMFLSHENHIVVDSGFQFIYNHKGLFPEDLYNTIVEKLREAKLIDKNKVRIIFDKKINNMMLQSIGKLESINEICVAEFNNLGNDLRMLILGDYIRKNYLSDVGTGNAFTQIGIVPIFETVRRSLGTRAKIGVLTGSLVILPESTLNEIRSIAEKKGLNLIGTPLVEGYVAIENISKSSLMVSLITAAFQMGLIEILIGTKSLLGEGWDSPNINSLILASFVGSYVLSNQMRGRAIRIDPTNKNKSANIWHLVTVEPPNMFKNKFMLESAKRLGSSVYNSSDFLTLERRFKTFVGPHYSKNIIENGIKRIDIITPPFDKAGIDRINKKMLKLANDREGMKQKWVKALGEDNYKDSNTYEMQKQVEIKEKKSPEISFVNHFLMVLFVIALIGYFALFAVTFIPGLLLDDTLFLGPVFIIYNFLLFAFIKNRALIARITIPKKRLTVQSKAVLKTFVHMGLVTTKKARVKVAATNGGDTVSISLLGGSAYEKEIFATALTEMTTPIKKQKYLLIHKSKRKITRYFLATPCPELIARRKENVEYLQKVFNSNGIPYDVVYTRNNEGREIMLKARKQSSKSLDTARTAVFERYAQSGGRF